MKPTSVMSIGVVSLVGTFGLLLVTCNRSLSPVGPESTAVSPSVPPITEAPRPEPEPSAAPKGCGLPPGHGDGNDCPRQNPTFLDAVESAIDHAVAQKPHLFDLNKTQGCGRCYQIRDLDGYAQAVVEDLESAGLCAIYDGEELAVKNTNDFNDQYDIVTSEFYVRRELGSYRSTCYPAWF